MLFCPAPGGKGVAGASLPDGLRTVANTQAAVQAIADFTASSDYTGFADKAAFSPANIKIAGKDTTSAATNERMVSIAVTAVPIVLGGYDGGTNKGVIDGSQSTDGKTRGILRIGSGAQVTLADNLTLSGGVAPVKNEGNSWLSFGGGVYVEKDSTFTMTGGAISGNTAIVNQQSYDSTCRSYGGGVYLESNCTLTVSGGAISGNKVSTVRGGRNSSEKSYGGGIFGQVGCAFIMSGGFIKDNTAVVNGNDKNEVKEGYTYGGGVYLDANSTFTMSGGEICGNMIADGWDNCGGGVHMAGNKAYFTMSGGSIHGNSVEITWNKQNTKLEGSVCGGGVSIIASTQVTLSGSAEIRNNSVRNGQKCIGGGVYVKTGTTTMSGGIISGNKIEPVVGAAIDYNTGGGGIRAGMFTMNGGLIRDNDGLNKGGGVYASDFTMNGGTISGNKAVDGGGVYAPAFTLSGKVSITGNTLLDNTTKSNVYLPSGKQLTIIGLLTGGVGSIGVTSAVTTKGTVIAAGGGGYELTKTDAAKIVSEADGVSFTFDESAKQLKVAAPAP